MLRGATESFADRVAPRLSDLAADPGRPGLVDLLRADISQIAKTHAALQLRRGQATLELQALRQRQQV